jgi:hypothetical protein
MLTAIKDINIATPAIPKLTNCAYAGKRVKYISVPTIKRNNAAPFAIVIPVIAGFNSGYVSLFDAKIFI